MIKTISWFMIVGLLLFLIFFLLSVPSIDEYSLTHKLAWFDINVWEKADCSKIIIKLVFSNKLILTNETI